MIRELELNFMMKQKQRVSFHNETKGEFMNIDLIDLSIIHLLQEDARLTNKEIGEKTHLTGQAVGNRITKLIEEEIGRAHV